MTDALDRAEQFVTTPHEDVPAWMNDHFAEISRVLQRLSNSSLVEPVHVEPFRKYDGLMVFADGTDFDPGLGRGMYYWDSVEDAWIPLFFRPSYGGIDNIQTIVALNDINTTPQVIQAAEGAVTTPVDVVQDLANNAVIVNKLGIWDFQGSVNLAFDDVNAGRTYQTEIYNFTDDVVVVSADGFVGRNTDGSTWAIAFLLTVREPLIGKQLQIRVSSSSDTFTNVTQRRMVFHVIRLDKDRTPA